MLLLYRVLYNIDVVMQVGGTYSFMLVSSIILLFIAVFSPVAGLLTDIRFSRYRAVVYSSWLFIVKVVFVLVLAIFSLVGYYHSLKFFDTKNKRFIFLVTVYSMLAVFVTIDITFIINAFQFGMDQLHDSPTEDSILFIHWYVWIYYACTLLTEIP